MEIDYFQLRMQIGGIGVAISISAPIGDEDVRRIQGLLKAVKDIYKNKKGEWNVWPW